MISAYAHRQKMIGELRSTFQNFYWTLWINELRCPYFWKRVDVYDLSSVCFAFGKRRHHSRMIGSRVLSDYQNGMCDIEVFEFHCPLAYSERFNEGGS